MLYYVNKFYFVFLIHGLPTFRKKCLEDVYQITHDLVTMFEMENARTFEDFWKIERKKCLCEIVCITALFRWQKFSKNTRSA